MSCSSRPQVHLCTSRSGGTSRFRGPLAVVTSIRRGIGTTGLGVILTGMVLPAATAGGGQVSDPAPGDGARECALPWPADPTSLPLVAEHRYVVNGKARPLIFFWIGRDNVGSARIAQRQGPRGTRVFEFSAHSNPERAPGGMNRWGFIVERVEEDAAQTVGMMTESDEESIEEAKRRIAQAHEDGGMLFNTFRAVTGADEACASSGKTYVRGDVEPHSIDQLFAIAKRADDAPEVKRMALPEGARPGFLVGLVELVERSVEAFRRQGAPPDETPSVIYVFNGRLYDLTIRKTRLLSDATIGARTYDTLLRSNFELRNRTTGWKAGFICAYGAAGSLAGVPVYFEYQPRWWVKVELAMEGTRVVPPAR